MSWSPPSSHRDSTPKWDLYRTRRPGGSRRRWPFVVAAAVAAGGVTALVIVLVGGRTGSGAPAPSSPADWHRAGTTAVQLPLGGGNVVVHSK